MYLRWLISVMILRRMIFDDSIFIYGAASFTVIATKADKLAKTRVKDAVRRVAAAFRTGEGNVIAVSNETRRGKDEVLSVLDSVVAGVQCVEEI